VVGIGNTACEIALSLVEHASRVHQSYRHGRIILSRFYENGYPSDMVGPWPSLRFGEHLRHHLPLLSRTLADRGHERQMVSDVMRLDPALNRPGLSQRQKRKLAQDRIRRQWHLLPCASATQVHPVVQEHWIPALSQQQIVPVRGFKSFGEGGQVHFQDGSTIEDVDAVIFCTGYSLDFSIFPALEMDGAEKIPVSKMRASSIQQQEPSLPRLFQMIFPPKWASSIAFLSWMSVLDTAWCTCELASMAVAQAWAADCAQEFGLTKSPSNVRPSALLPSEKKMNASVDAYQDWWRKQWRKEPSFHPGYPQSHTFVRFLHETAGTGMFDHMDHPWTLNRWKLWWKDRALYTWLTKGPANSHAFRLFDTNPDGVPGCGRRTWQGARHAVEKEVCYSLLCRVIMTTNKCSTICSKRSKGIWKKRIRKIGC
jgi:dimethylaniline monooxygenase (N-oxide forming)